MDRKEFLITLGKGAAVAGLVFCAGCSLNNSDIPNAPANIDNTYDFSKSQYGTLNSVGGSYVDNGIIIGRISSTEFVAVSAACTHQGTTINFQLNNKRFYCNSHGSAFDFNGNVIQGPASRALNKYNTSFSGNTLRVYS